MKDLSITAKTLEDQIEWDEDTMETEMNKIRWLDYMIPLTSLITSFYLADFFYENIDKKFGGYKRDYKNFAMPMTEWESASSNLAASSDAVSIKMQKGGGASIFVPILNKIRILNMGHTSAMTAYNNKVLYDDDDFEVVFKAMEKLFGKNFFNIDKACIADIPVKDPFTNPGITTDMVDDEPEDVMFMLEAIQSIKLIAEPAGAHQVNRNTRTLAEAMKDADPRYQKVELAKSREYSVVIELKFPKEFIQYVTQSKVVDRVHLHQYLTFAVRQAAQGDDVVESINPFKNIRQVNMERTVGKEVKRANENNLSIDADGEPIYIPNVDNVLKFDQMYDNAGHDDADLGWSINNKVGPYVPQAKSKKAELDNKVIYYDPYYAKISYAANSAVQVRDLEGCVAAEPYHILSIINTTLESNTIIQSLKSMNFYLKHLNIDSIMEKLEIDLNDFAPLYDRRAGRIVHDFGSRQWYGELNDNNYKSYIKELMLDQGIIGYIELVTSSANLMNRYYTNMLQDGSMEMPKGQEWVYNYTPGQLLLKDVNPNSELKMLRPVGQLLKLLSDEILKDPIRSIEMRSPSTGMQAMGMATIIGKYMPDIKKLEEASKEHYKSIEPVHVGNPDWKAPALPGSKPGFVYLPHQGKVKQALAKKPKLAILSVSAGGGKTLLAITHIMDMINAGHYKKPLIMCPPYLVSNYIEDLITVSGGSWNIIPINRSTYASHGEDNLRAMINGAPPNTIFITDFNFNKGGSDEVSYGTTVITVSENSEFLRSFGFDYVVLDESHFVKNTESQVTKAAQQLTSTIPAKAIMSGTIVDGTPVDLVGQSRILISTVFGSMKDFMREYAVSWRGNKVLQWQDGAIERMRDKLEEHIAFIQATKREWSSLLPDRKEKFHGVSLTDNQMTVYHAILKQVLDEIRNDPRLMKSIKSSEEDDGASLEQLLNPYLARLEQFLTSPADDSMAGKNLLSGDDAISPKVKVIADIVKEHIDKKIPGKILVFTSYNRSAKAIFENLPKSIKKHAMLYRASRKAEHKAKFAKDDNIKVMVGIEQSLNTGHNFQFVSRVIRAESVWNPGTLEQAESRIFRPDVQNLYNLSAKYLDWVIADGTIDVTKAARLMSKVLVKAAFDERNNPLYDKLPMPDLIPMTLDSITDNNDWREDLSEHLNAYQLLRDIQKEDYEAYRNDPKTLKKPFKVPSGPSLKGAALINNIPYVDNHVLPFQEDLGLMGVSTAAAEDGTNLDDFDITGKAVHTEFGDGIVERTNKSTIRIRIGKKTLTTGKLKAFIFLDQAKAKKDLANKDYVPVSQKIAKLVNLPLRNITADGKVKNTSTKKMEEIPTKPSTKNQVTLFDQVEKKLLDSKDKQENQSFELLVMSVNNQVCVAVDAEDPDVPSAETMQSLGFEYMPSYHYAHISNKKRMANLKERVDKYIAQGKMTMPDVMRSEFDRIAGVFEKSKNAATALDKIDQNSMRMFLKLRRQKSKNPATDVYMHFVVEDEELYALVTTDKAPRGNKFVKAKIPGITWDEDDSGTWVSYHKTKGEAKAFAQSLMNTYKISNKKDFIEGFREIRIRKTMTSG